MERKIAEAIAEQTLTLARMKAEGVEIAEKIEALRKQEAYDAQKHAQQATAHSSRLQGLTTELTQIATDLEKLISREKDLPKHFRVTKMREQAHKAIKLERSTLQKREEHLKQALSELQPVIGVVQSSGDDLSELAGRAANLEQRKLDRQSALQELLTQLSPHEAKLYERAFALHPAQPISFVTQKACSACGNQVRELLIQQARIKQEELCCEGCRRLMVVVEAEPLN